MKIQTIPYQRISALSATDRAFIQQSEELNSFLPYPFDQTVFEKIILHRKEYATDRILLVDVLKDQYKKRRFSAISNQQIESLLDENTYTITTAHQPCLLGGPFYYIYKIASTICLANECNKLYANKYHFVPVYWCGSEDHDFEELNHVSLFHKSVVWQDFQGGAVGRYDTTSLEEILKNQVFPILGDSETAQDLKNIFSEAFSENRNFAEATLYWLHELFSAYGLLVLQPDEARLKRSFIPMLEKEIFTQASLPFVRQTIEELAKKGFKNQAFPREINVFYLGKNYRERIIQDEDGNYAVLNTNLVFSPQALQEHLHEYPEHFSPNVVLRPLYQEYILPNLAYIGGGGEIAYWLERWAQFRHFGVHYPMLIRRNSAMILDKTTQERIEKWGFDWTSIFESEEDLIKKFIAQNTATDLSLEAERMKMSAVWDEILSKSIAADPNLEKTILAEKVKWEKSMENIEDKLLRAEKRRHETVLGQIKQTKEKLFPNKGLQERHDSFIPFYLKHGKEGIAFLIAHFYPFDTSFFVLVED